MNEKIFVIKAKKITDREKLDRALKIQEGIITFSDDYEIEAIDPKDLECKIVTEDIKEERRPLWRRILRLN